uniref:DUF4283 domain-containing protein n=1 Tax=Cajanus cajan TaxID=3821 RepID=A0A151RAT7_CAJCA|nr:hypothetical protein KK1_039048 [Cajanus cajan]
MLREKLKGLWKLVGGFEIMDMNNGYFLVSFNLEEDKYKAINFFYHYLKVGPRVYTSTICIKIDLHTPIMGKFSLNEKWYNVEYKGLHMLCGNCGCYGHITQNPHMLSIRHFSNENV